MRFIRDLLFVELAAAGEDLDRDPVVQVGAVLLARDNLLEKSGWATYVKTTYLDSQLAAHAALVGADAEDFRRAPKASDAVRLLHKTFGDQVTLCVNNVGTLIRLRAMFKKAGLPFPYDPHVLSLWSVSYVYAVAAGFKKLPTVDTFSDYFRLSRERVGDALSDARLMAEIFRRIVRGA